MATKVFKQILMVYKVVFIHVKLLSYFMYFIVMFFITIGDTKLEANVYWF